MSGFELLAALVGSLAWPLVVLVVAILFRRQLAALLARPFAHLKAGPLEIKWDREITEVKAELESPPPPAGRPGHEGPAESDLTDLARTDPTAAVMKAFIRVEKQLRALLAGAGIEAGRVHAKALARQALEAKLIKPETMRAVEGLTVLRNLAAHGQAEDLSEGRALEYLTVADAVSYALTQNGGGSGSTG